MKKVLFMIACVMALTACQMDLNNWGSKTLKASKNIVTKEYHLTPFEEVELSCVGAVELIQSETKDGVVELTAPDNYIDLYKFTSDGKKLDIDYAKRGVNIHNKYVKIKVYTTDLIKLENSGAATIKMDSLDTDRIEIENSGVGDIKIGGIADEAELICSGVGSIHAGQLKALKVKAEVSGVGSIECYASEEIEGGVSGVGSLKYGGHPKQKKTSRSGIGSISEK
ncbi:MAG: DUF2807 domain-containing protein [Prevotella sp.]|nr:DUF2807 domain-containing protein [Prevotella sp.]